MFFALYGQFVINICLFLFMCLQVYRNYKLQNTQNHLERSMEESNEDIEQYKENMASILVTFSQELDSLKDNKKSEK